MSPSVIFLGPLMAMLPDWLPKVSSELWKWRMG